MGTRSLSSRGGNACHITFIIHYLLCLMIQNEHRRKSISNKSTFVTHSQSIHPISFVTALKDNLNPCLAHPFLFIFLFLYQLPRPPPTLHLSTQNTALNTMCRHIHIQHLDPKPMVEGDVKTCKVIFERCQKDRMGDPCQGSKVVEVVREKKECQWCNKDWKMPLVECG